MNGRKTRCGLPHFTPPEPVDIVVLGVCFWVTEKIFAGLAGMRDLLGSAFLLKITIFFFEIFDDRQLF
jgi:hypothetical protein